MNISGEALAFILLSVMIIAGGLLLLYLRKVVHMVLAAVLSFVGIAGLFLLLSAEFLAAVQILIYSGAVTIIMLFGIMLTDHSDHERKKTGTRNLFVLLGIAGFAAVVYMGIYDLEISSGEEAALHEENTEKIGIALFSKYIIPFEMISVLLLVALVGAVILAKKEDGREERDN